jgi:hypothetical protein
MKKMLLVVLLCTLAVVRVLFFSASNHAGAAPGDLTPTKGTAVNLARGELIYVPIYSRIFYEDAKAALELAATLSIHNVNPDRSITVTKADYYDTSGKPIHKYLEAPLVLKPLETKNLVIERANTAGGAGANFLVEWHSDTEVTSPLVEALMVNASHNLGISFTSNGKVVQRFGGQQ